MAEVTQNRSYFNFGSGHILAAVIAAAVSAVIHIGLAVIAMHVNLSLSTTASQQAPPRKYESLQLESVNISPAVEEKVLETLRSVNSDTTLNTAEIVDDLSVAPEESITEPPQLSDMNLAGETAGLAEPTPPPMINSIAPPRQEIIAIENIAVGDTLPKLERRVIPKLERVSNAPDIIMPSSTDMVATQDAGAAIGRITAPKVANIAKYVIGGMGTAKLITPPTEEDKETLPGGSKELFEEKVEDVTKAEPIERVLTATVQTYSSRRDKKYSYFKLSVKRAGREVLPVLPKDIILVQDCSASMSESRLRFCRKGLLRALTEIGANDRFNIAKFSDRTETCFTGWVKKTPQNLEKAKTYIKNMVAQGNTDLFASMSDLLQLKTDPSRPMIAFVITDGLVNKGITDNSEIIGEFSRKNAGKISVFTLGTSQLANRYLIDLLSYCNKGYVNLVSKGRWDIPDSIEKVMHGISRPVLADLTIQTPSAASYEIYPRQISNLYLDRPIILYGRYLKGERRLIFQAMGKAGSTPCDMIFNLPLQERSGKSRKDEDIRKKWAQRKIYHLIGEYTRTKDKATLLELRRTSRKYKEPIPYKRRIF